MEGALLSKCNNDPEEAFSEIIKGKSLLIISQMF